jgi:hypothetical protein
MQAYSPRAYTATPVPGAFELHMMNRMGCGFTPATLAQLRAAGGSMPWFEKQLHPASIPESSKVSEIDSWFPGRYDSMATRWDNLMTHRKKGFDYGVEIGNWTMLRRIFSNRTVFENMVDFWSNHFHVPAFADKAWLGRQLYDSAIRAHALGRFDELLATISLQPSMLIYLDNSKSVRGAPNENQGRELLELHTVGGDSGYTEDMVKDSAVILSGWTVHEKGSWEAYYSTDNHTTGAVTVLGFSHANTSSDGRAVTAAYLNYLAHHPSTARTIAKQLAIRFVNDTPSESLIATLAQVFLDSGTDIKATLRALVSSDEFRASAGTKVRTAYDDLVATARVLRVNPHAPTSKSSFALAISHVHGADLLFSWPRPDGAPQANANWCSASRMLCSYQFHWGISGRYYPAKDVTYRAPAAWLPQPRIRFDSFIDHLSRVLVGRSSTSLVLQAACEATGVDPWNVITSNHPVCDYMFPRMIAALLDSPAHLTR